MEIAEVIIEYQFQEETSCAIQFQAQQVMALRVVPRGCRPFY